MRAFIPLRFRLCLLAAASLVLPVVSSGDTIHLTDGSTLKGRVVAFASDTLTLQASFGGAVRVPRSRISWIDFSDTLRAGVGPSAPAPGGAPRAGAEQAGGEGELLITFKDRGLSSKVKVTRRKDEEGILRANWIAQTLVVDGDTAYTRVDTSMDKTIYKGPDRLYKNEIELEDMSVRLPAGPHSVSLLVRNLGAETYAERFDADPLDLQLLIGDVVVYAGRSAVVHVGIKRGKLRLGKARFYRVE